MPDHKTSPWSTVLPATVTTDPHVRDARLAVLPIGSFEQHGPHLPLVTDTLIAAAVSVAVAETTPALLLPPITVSCSHEHAAFPGTISITMATMSAVITDIAESLRQQGVDQLLIVNGHGGNYGLANLVQQSVIGPVRMALYPAREDWDDARQAAGITSSAHDDMHAGELETSILLATYPDAVRDGWQNADHTHDDRRHLTTLGIAAYTTSGIIGQPSAATADKGRAALSQLADNAATTIAILNRTVNQP
jgi:creatinine amidohydrolase